MVAQYTQYTQSPARTARFYNAKSGVVATFHERALDLAEAHGLIGTGRGVALTYTADGETPAWVTVRVVSQSKADVTYDVVYTVATDHALCRCTAAAFGRPCAHAGAAIAYGRYVAALYTPKARVEAWDAEASVSIRVERWRNARTRSATN